MLKPHECGDSRLRCIDCDGQVCPKCFVQCPVGNRCKPCTAKFSSHVLQVSPLALVKMFVTALVLGGAFGAAQSLMPGGGLFMWLIVYAIGVAAGNIIHKVGGFKIGAKVLVATSVGVIVGWYAVSESMPNMEMPEAKMAHRALPEYYRTAALKADRNIEAMAQAQHRLPEMVAALNRHESCYVLVATADGARQWLRVKEANGDSLTGTDTVKDETRTVTSADVIDWQYIGKTGTEGGFLIAGWNDAAESVAPAANYYRTYRYGYGIIDLLLFLAGILTVMSGQVPQFRLPYFRN